MKENKQITIKHNSEQIDLASKLTTLQRKFVLNLIATSMSQREAYIAAGGKAKTQDSQDSAACTMFSNVKVRAYYDSLLESAQTSAVMTKEQALTRLSQSAQIKITDVCTFRNVKVGEDEDGNDVYQTVWTVKNAEDIPDHIAVCIKSVTITNQGPKIELHDSHGAIKQLGDILGWNAPKKSELTGKDGKPLAVRADVNSKEVVDAVGKLMERL